MYKKKRVVYSVLRGFKILKKEDKLGLWESIRFALLKTCPLGDASKSKFFFGIAHSDAEIAIHQYCIDRMIELWLGKKLFIQAKNSSYKIIWPATRRWLELFEGRGIRMNHILSRVSWIKKVLLIYCYNILNVFILIYKVNPIQSKSFSADNFCYFDKIFENNVPKNSQDENYCLINWFLKSEIKKFEIKHIFHNIKKSNNLNINGITIKYGPLPYEMPLNWNAYLNFLLWYVSSLSLTILDIFCLRWHHPVMLLEAARLKIVELTEQKNLARDYYFHWSAGVYRPLWTYGAYQRGSGISLYFYSVIEAPTIKTRVDNQRSQYWLLNWPQYLCWNQRQANNIKDNNAFNPNIILVGPIWFADSGLKTNSNISSYVAVFCVEYFRKAFYIGFSSLNDYFENNPDLPRLFLADIEFCCAELGLKMLHKRKRLEGRRELKKYKKTINELSAGASYIQANPNESTIRMIKSAKCVLCFPFTSVALQAQDMGKKVAYYDPMFWIDKDDPASNGIQVIQGRNELLEWISAN